MNSIGILKESLNITKDGKYTADGKTVIFMNSTTNLKNVVYFPEKDVMKITVEQILKNCKQKDSQRTIITVTNRDTLSAALAMSRMNSHTHDSKIMVLNFANPVNPGGGVRYGATAQEEDLCRRSTLLMSLESEDAAEYYRFHKEQCDCFSSHSIVVSPNVEVFRSYNNALLPYTFQVSVLTCAAPIVDGVKSKPYTYAEYTTLLSDRIAGILSVCSKMGYKKLVLGAWGCGSFGNDPMLVAGLFEKNIRLFNGSFEEIEFAVLGNEANFDSFHKVFVLSEFD